VFRSHMCALRCPQCRRGAFFGLEIPYTRCFVRFSFNLYVDCVGSFVMLYITDLECMRLLFPSFNFEFRFLTNVELCLIFSIIILLSRELFDALCRCSRISAPFVNG
jgi:hypothetical protein